MTISAYLYRIHNLCNATRVTEFSNAAELEKRLLEIPFDQREKGLVQLIFLQKRADDESYVLNPLMLKQMTSSLDLMFITEKENEGNVCFANSSELRVEFKQAFTTVDLLAYHYALLHSLRYREANKAFLKDADLRVLIPPNVDFFWKLVQIGSDLLSKEEWSK